MVAGEETELLASNIRFWTKPAGLRNREHFVTKNMTEKQNITDENLQGKWKVVPNYLLLKM